MGGKIKRIEGTGRIKKRKKSEEALWDAVLRGLKYLWNLMAPRRKLEASHGQGMNMHSSLEIQGRLNLLRF